MYGNFWRSGDMKRRMIVYEKNKWKMRSELKWIFHISIFFEKKFELEFTRHSRLLIVKRTVIESLSINFYFSVKFRIIFPVYIIYFIAY